MTPSVIDDATVYLADFPLQTPYKVSSRMFHSFEPVIVRLRSANCPDGWGEAVITRGYSSESADEVFDHCRQLSSGLIGKTTAAARQLIADNANGSIGATTIMLSAIDMLERNPILQIAEPLRLPLLEPVHAMALPEIPDAIEQLLEQGYKTLKVKVGFDVKQDLNRIAAIQQALNGRAEIRLDANQGFTSEQGQAFGRSLDPTGIQLFEQPCGADQWQANSDVAAVSTVPVMLDESIYGLPDIERAAGITGVGYVKLKLKKMGSVDLLRDALERIRALGMRPVMGDGVATDICCWMEACVGRMTLDNAGEMNGYLKLKQQLFAEPLPFSNGEIVLPAGYTPRVDEQVLTARSVREESFGTSRSRLQ